jgi:hypothetical protein
LVAAPLSQTAYAHGIAGNLYFPGTLTFDDPAVADEAIVPLNSASGHHIGGRAQLLLFLDDLAPSLFGKPLLSR